MQEKEVFSPAVVLVAAGEEDRDDRGLLPPHPPPERKHVRVQATREIEGSEVVGPEVAVASGN